MKRLNKLIIVVLLFFIFLLNVNASTNTYSRTRNNNYGVNKKWDMNSYRINKALKTPYVDASEKIYDFSDILTDDEENDLYLLIEDFIEETGWDFVFVSDDVVWYSEATNEDYAADFYDYNDFGLDNVNYDGVILFRNTYSKDRYYCAYTFGNTQLYFDQVREDKVLDDIYSYFVNDNYYDGIKLFIKEMKEFYNSGVVDRNEYIDKNGFVRKNINYLEILIESIFRAIPLALIPTVVIILILVSKNKMIKAAYNATEYLDRGTVAFTDKRDVFISSHTSSYTRSSSSGGGGGHSSGGGSRSSSGSSGGGHSGGGRRG